MFVVIFYRKHKNNGGEEYLVVKSEDNAIQGGWMEILPNGSVHPRYGKIKCVKDIMFWNFDSYKQATEFVKVFQRSFYGNSGTYLHIIDNFEGEVEEWENDCGPDIVDMFDSYCGR